MKKNSILTPLLRTIDKVIFGFQDIYDSDEHARVREQDNEEEFDVERSTN